MATDSIPRILAVEDDSYIRLLFTYLLRGHYEVILVGTVDEALQTASCQRFDLFLLDINLQEDRTGLDLLNMLRRMPEYSRTPAVACTAYIKQDNSDVFKVQGFNSYLEKPFTREVLLQTIQDNLKAARQAASPEPPSPAGVLVSKDSLRNVAA